MEHGYPLARLAACVAAARMRGRPTRIVVRNTERFGLIHLYFEQGHLIRIEGHRGSPLAALTDLATWQYGVLRQDDMEGEHTGGAIDPRLDAALFDVLGQLEARGVVQPVPPVPQFSRSGAGAAGAPNVSQFRRSASAASVPSWATPPAPRSLRSQHSQPTGPSATVSTPADLPPLDAIREIPEPPPSLRQAIAGEPLRSQRQPAAAQAVPQAAPIQAAQPIPAAQPLLPEEERLTEPQWQLIALVVRQILEKASGIVGEQMAQSMLRQALGHAARTGPLLTHVELDTSGWLRVLPPHEITQYSAYDVVDAIAALLTGFETRCATLVGAEQAQHILMSAAAPFRASLVQIGLDISA